MLPFLSVVIDDLDLVYVSARPAQTNPPLVVDPDTVLCLAVALERLEPVSRRRHQVSERLRAENIEQLAARRALDCPKSGDWAIVEQRLGIGRPDGLYHLQMVLREA